VETESGFAGRIAVFEMPPRRLQQRESTNKIGLQEIARNVDRAVDVTFGGQMHHRIRVMRFEYLAHGLASASAMSARINKWRSCRCASSSASSEAA
jgi:hypothetical protein